MNPGGSILRKNRMRKKAFNHLSIGKSSFLYAGHRFLLVNNNKEGCVDVVNARLRTVDRRYM